MLGEEKLVGGMRKLLFYLPPHIHRFIFLLCLGAKMVVELHPGTPSQVELATRRPMLAASLRPLTPQMQAEVDSLVFKPQRQIPTAGSNFLPRRQPYHQSTPQRKASASANNLPHQPKPKLSHQTTTPALIRPVPEGHVDKDTESHFIKGSMQLADQADAGNAFDAVYSGFEGEVCGCSPLASAHRAASAMRSRHPTTPDP